MTKQSNREYLIINYRTDPDAIREHLPEPLMPVGDTVAVQRLRQRHMLRLAVGRQAPGICGEKGERGCFVPAIFGKVEMHPANQIPRWMTRLEKIL